MTSLETKLKNVDGAAVSLIMKCLTIDPEDRYECKSLLEDDYFDNYEFEAEINGMIMTDTTEFHMASTIRDGMNFFSPRHSES